MGGREGFLDRGREKEEGIVGGLWVDAGLVSEEGIEADDRGGGDGGCGGDKEDEEGSDGGSGHLRRRRLRMDQVRTI